MALGPTQEHAVDQTLLLVMVEEKALPGRLTRISLVSVIVGITPMSVGTLGMLDFDTPEQRKAHDLVNELNLACIGTLGGVPLDKVPRIGVPVPVGFNC